MAASADDSLSRLLRRASLTVSAGLAAGAAVSAAAVVYRRTHRRMLESLPVSSSAGDIVEEVVTPAPDGILWSELARHDSLDEAWIAISGQVYNVTPFLEDHPGGKLLLLAFAGREATEPFETVGHSALAQRELRRLRVGALCKDPHTYSLVKAGADGGARRVVERLRGGAQLTGGSKAADEEGAASLGLWEVGSRGFMPTRDPVGIEALFGTKFDVFAELADLLPSMGFTGALRKRLDGDSELQRRLLAAGDASALQGLSEDQIERAFMVAGYTMLAYWRGGTLAYSSGTGADHVSRKNVEGGTCNIDDTKFVLPAFLAKPLLLLSNHLGRPPMPDYIATVLYNWTRIDKTGPVSTSNIRCVVRLTGLQDEEWFFKTHVIIESEAAQIVASIIRATETKDDDELLSLLMDLEEALWRVVRACLPIMYERNESGTPQCSEHMFYQVLRPLIKAGTLAFEGDTATATTDTGAAGNSLVPRFLHGPSGAMSSLLPCIDAACGIETSSARLRDALKMFEKSMPHAHREFLAKLKSQPSIRDRILATRPESGEVNEQHDALTRSFNRVISRVLDFRWQHWQYVKNYIMKPGALSHAVGSGGTSFDYLQQHITDTEKARIRERGGDGFSKLHTENGELPPMHLPPTPAAGRRDQTHSREFWSVDGDHGLLSREPLVAPNLAPWGQTLVPPMLEAMNLIWDLCQKVPSLCTGNGPYYETVDALAPKLAVLQDDRAVAGLSESAREYLMTSLSHIKAGCMASGNRKPPRCIEKPLQVVARSVGRPPFLDFTELVLCNWDTTTVDSTRGQEAEQAAGHQDETPEPKRHVVWRFLAMPDEEWYRATHIVMHEEAREVVAAIRVGHVAMRDLNDRAAVSSMVRVGAWCNKFCDFFDAYFEAKDSRTESVMIRRLEPFITRSGNHELSIEETACWVYCMGSSVLFLALHAYLGIQMCPEFEAENPEVEALGETLRRMIKEGRVCMPVAHREFLEQLEKPGVSMRQYCFRRFGAKRVSVEVLHDLEAGYNDSLYALGRLLSRRVHLVSRFFPQLAGNFGALNSDLEAAMQHSRLQLLNMRQRVFRSLQA
eukprot:CAMPEP_0206434876 /NCGR_PEP_ID=MMETSP0324_2-20121206/9473_1 /ASSEMBLY_ACC=CAM_ASM_000836 /TAXON_ID=2866 /ORGANISM="Crypthecodinium cohnii, Strain Seligo" /LENGTH=1076 /DNA_ID=CAMNT_0053901583 /DNA_START=62 /DNA_END=3292 /DNA_ORIENTATION=-